MADVDLEATRGDTNTYTMTAFKPPPDETDPLDLTGALVWMSVKRSVGDTPALIVKTIGSGILVAAPATGVATISLDPADTEDLTPGPYLYDVQLKEASGRVTTIAKGTLALEGDITLMTA